MTKTVVQETAVEQHSIFGWFFAKIVIGFLLILFCITLYLIYIDNYSIGHAAHISLKISAVIIFVSFIPLSVTTFTKLKSRQKQVESRIFKKLGLDPDDVVLTVPEHRSDYRIEDFIVPVLFAMLLTTIGSVSLFFGAQMGIDREPSFILSGGQVIASNDLVSAGDQVSAVGAPQAPAPSAAKATQETQLLVEKGTVHVVQYSTFVVAIWAFLGAMIWSMQNIFRRMINLDLFPGVFYNIAIRMLLACFVSMLVWYFLLFIKEGAAAGAGLLDWLPDRTEDAASGDFSVGSFFAPVLGFVVGTFPTQWFQQLVDRVDERFRRASAGDTAAAITGGGGKKTDTERIRRACRLPLEMIQGMNTFHKARLNELGIDNCQNLAKSHVLKILLRTPFQAELVVDWIGQALLIVHFRDEIDNLRGAGVRTVFDLTALESTGDPGSDQLLALSSVSQIDVNKLRIIHQVLRHDNRLQDLEHTRVALRPGHVEPSAQAPAPVPTDALRKTG